MINLFMIFTSAKLALWQKIYHNTIIPMILQYFQALKLSLHDYTVDGS